MKKLLMIGLSVLMALGLVACGGEKSSDESKAETTAELTTAANAVADWPTTDLVKHIPALTVGTVTKSQERDSGKRHDIHAKLELQEYKDYVESCKKAGYTLETETSDYNHKYRAFNNDGYKVYLTYDEGDKDAEIIIYAAVEYADLVWPTVGLGANAPAPNIKKGNITSDTSDYFVAELQMNTTEFNQYANDLMSAGFTNDYVKYEGYFRGINSSGIEVRMSEVGSGTVEFHISAAS